MVEETQTSSTDLEEINTEDELATDTSNWSDKEHKKLQHMTGFHREYQRFLVIGCHYVPLLENKFLI